MPDPHRQLDETRETPRRRRLPALLSVAALAFGGFGLAACGDDDTAAPETAGGGANTVAEQPEEAPSEVTLSELLENPAQYIGEQVTVSGQVTDADADRETATAAAFTLGERADQDLLVLPTMRANVEAADITDESVLRVQGTVVEVDADVAEEDEFLFEDADNDEFLGDFTDQVAVAATSVDTNVPTPNDEAPE